MVLSKLQNGLLPFTLSTDASTLHCFFIESEGRGPARLLRCLQRDGSRKDEADERNILEAGGEDLAPEIGPVFGLHPIIIDRPGRSRAVITGRKPAPGSR